MRKTQPALAAETFDVVIKVGAYNLPPGMPPRVAIVAIRDAVQAMPGAEAVSVEHHPIAGRDGTVSVFPASHSVLARQRLRTLVERAMHAAIAVAAAAQPPSFAMPMAGPLAGFSDSQGFPPVLLREDATTGRMAPEPITEPVPLGDFSDSDLLAHLLQYVVQAEGNAPASRAVERFGSFAAVLSAPEIELRTVPGLGTHSIAAIKLMHAAALRLFRAAVMDQPHLDDGDALIAYLTAALARESIEHFRILFLDSEGRLRADEAQARGTVNHTPVYPREVVRRALELKAASIILVHNHPSGDPSPSIDDLDMTAMIESAGEAVGITVRDHIIVGNGRWLSFRRENLLGRDC